jgi:hypothetical protein
MGREPFMRHEGRVFKRPQLLIVSFKPLLVIKKHHQWGAFTDVTLSRANGLRDTIMGSEGKINP